MRDDPDETEGRALYRAQADALAAAQVNYGRRKVRQLKPNVNETIQVAKLVDELFAAIEASQGYFHVSDGETFASRAKFFERIRGRLSHGKEAVRKMERFLVKHGETYRKSRSRPAHAPSAGEETK